MKKLMLSLFMVSCLAYAGIDDLCATTVSAEGMAYSTQEEEEEVYSFADKMPQFPGGNAELMKYIDENLIYPPTAKEKGIQGRVIVRFVVKSDGSIGNAQVIRSLDPECDKEAIRVIKSLPKWTPGEASGTPVAVWFTAPVPFSLK